MTLTTRSLNLVGCRRFFRLFHLLLSSYAVCNWVRPNLKGSDHYLVQRASRGKEIVLSGINKIEQRIFIRLIGAAGVVFHFLRQGFKYVEAQYIGAQPIHGDFGLAH